MVACEIGSSGSQYSLAAGVGQNCNYIWGCMCYEFFLVHLLNAFRNVVTEVLFYEANYQSISIHKHNLFTNFKAIRCAVSDILLL
jgi:hypothetical protein